MFSERLKAARMEAGLSQKALAEKLFVSQQAVGKWEVDQGSPNPETIARMAEIFDISADYLLGLTSQKKKPPTGWDERLGDAEIIERLVSLTPEELGKVDAFVQGMLASRSKDTFPPR